MIGDESGSGLSQEMKDALDELAATAEDPWFDVEDCETGA